jgi:cation diffusion facilitator CzcD-associated flavoprotein CzcO
MMPATAALQAAGLVGSAASSGKDDHPIVIVGAGFSGLGTAACLRRAGVEDFVILERARRVGGTWRDNTYPNCACDVPSALYSFSFAPNPSWSRVYAPASEIQAYLLRLVEDHDLESHIRYDHELLGGHWDDEQARWQLRTNRGTLRAAVVIAATGPLIEPSIPELRGLDSFAGESFHSSRWRHDIDLRGRRVAVVGTGASAVQFLPSVQRRAAHLTLFQRTAPWVLPKLDWSTGMVQRTLLRLSPVERLLRVTVYGLSELYGLGLFVDQRFLAPMEAIGRAHLARQVSDPELRSILTPRFRLGCKRILFSNTYYPALAADNASVVTEAIREVNPNGIVTADGKEHALDTIIFGTGFRIPTGPAIDKLVGRHGKTVADSGPAGDVEAHLGTTFSGFPNLFMIVGPNTGLGHNSLLYMIESQIAYVVDAVRTMRRRQIDAVDVRPDAQAAFNEYVQRASRGTVWLDGGCKSWYLNGDGKNTTLWPRTTFEYRRRTRHFDAKSYALRAQGDGSWEGLVQETG